MLSLRHFKYCNVNCRVGSLEMTRASTQRPQPVNCRVGSLEKDENTAYRSTKVNCRVGSLEIQGRLN